MASPYGYTLVAKASAPLRGRNVSGVQLIGNWNRLISRLNNVAVIKKITHEVISYYTKKMAMVIRKYAIMSINISRGFGEPWNSITLWALKSRKIRKDNNFINRPLLDTGELRDSIQIQQITPQVFLVGVIKGRTNKYGSMFNLAKIMEKGDVHITPSGKLVATPPRPFIKPAYEKAKPELTRIRKEAIAAVILTLQRWVQGLPIERKLLDRETLLGMAEEPYYDLLHNMVTQLESLGA